MSELVKVDKPRVVSIEHLARLATEKKAVVFNGGIVKPAAVVLHMQGAVIVKMLETGSLFEYVKPTTEKKPIKFYRNERKRPLYKDLESKNTELTEAAEYAIELIENGLRHDFQNEIEKAAQILRDAIKDGE